MKNLKDLTLKEYTDLRRSGLMLIVFPDATGDFREDCEEVKKVNDKCEWKDGTLIMCDKLTWYVKRDVSRAEEINYFDLCPFCGADIRKPEKKVCTQTSGCLSSWTCKTCCFYKPEPAEPLIVKSGETWVYYAEGINYICIDPNIYTKSRLLNLNNFYSEIVHWKSFTGPNPDITELTDEIAKLRPIMITDAWDKPTLIRVLNEQIFITYILKENGREYIRPDWLHIDNCRLATAHELQEIGEE